MSESLEQEVERLRQEVESYRQREMDELRQRLVQAQTEAAHYRAEAQRNADIGRQIAAQAESEIKTLKAQLEGLRHADAHAGRFGTR